MLLAVCCQVLLSSWLAKRYFVVSASLRSKPGSKWRAVEYGLLIVLALPFIALNLFFPVSLEAILPGAPLDRNQRAFLILLGCGALATSVVVGWRKASNPFEGGRGDA